MWLKLTIELALGSGCLACGLNFFAVVKSWHYRNKILSIPALMRCFINRLGSETLKSEGQLICRRCASHYDNVHSVLNDSNAALLHLGNCFLFGAFCLCTSSWFLGWYYLIFNLAILCGCATVPLSTPMKTNTLGEIYRILLYVYKWNTVNSQECSLLIPTRIPRLTIVLYVVQHDL